MKRRFLAIFLGTALRCMAQVTTVSPDSAVVGPGDTPTFDVKADGKPAGCASLTPHPAAIGGWMVMPTLDCAVGKLKFSAPTLDPGITQADLDVDVMAAGATMPATIHIRILGNPPKGADLRSNFEATAYLGDVVDNFAAQEQNKLNYPSDKTGVKNSYVVGIDFEYRLLGNAAETRPFRGSQLWVYGETIHAQRSADVNCTQQPPPDVCALATGGVPVDPNKAFLSVLRNATSLEGYTGARLEFLTLQRHSDDAAKVYLKSELGFITVTGLGHLIDSHQKIALGALATNGKYQGSYLEFGWGKTDLFQTHPGRRFKVDGYLTWDLNHWLKTKGFTPFIEITVDSDFGPGSDSVRTYYGFNFDLRNILIPGGK